MAIEEGKNAPDFTLNDPEGRPVSLSDFKGRNVIIYFYPRDNTPGCTKEAEGFRNLWLSFAEKEIAIIGISPDSEDSHARFLKKYRLPFILLSDPDKKVMNNYQAFGEKMMYGKKTVGVIRSTVWVGPDGKVVKHWKKVPKAADHPEKVLNVVDGRPTA